MERSLQSRIRYEHFSHLDNQVPISQRLRKGVVSDNNRGRRKAALKRSFERTKPAQIDHSR